MLSVNGDADAAVETRIWIRWNKFRHLLPLVTNDNISLIVWGRLYSGLVWSGQRWELLDGCVAWSYKIEHQVKGWERETRFRWQHLSTTAKQVVMIRACAARRR